MASSKPTEISAEKRNSRYDRIGHLGIVRLLLSLSLLITLLLNDIYDYYPAEYFVVNKHAELRDGLSTNFFYMLGYENLNIAKYLAIVMLLLVAAGVFPAITCFLHSWIAYSFITSSILVEGGDQLNAILSLLLIPACLSLGFQNAWRPFRPDAHSNKVLSFFRILFHHTMSVQVAICYFVASISKITVAEWAGGTALYYWMNHNVFGVSPLWVETINYLFSNSAFLYFSTVGVILLELLLGMGLFIKSARLKTRLFILGVLLHVFIWIFLGLGTFSMVMIAGLYILLMMKPELTLQQLYDYGQPVKTAIA